MLEFVQTWLPLLSDELKKIHVSDPISRTSVNGVGGVLYSILIFSCVYFSFFEKKW